MSDLYVWRANVRIDWAVDGARVFIHRSTGEHRDIVTSFDESGRWQVTREPMHATSDFPGLLIPREALDALAEEVKPGPSQGEVKRLEEALAIERRRVDDLLARLVAPANAQARES